MTVTQDRSSYGRIQIKPHKKFYRPFVEGFGQFCESSRPFVGQIQEVFLFCTAFLLVYSLIFFFYFKIRRRKASLLR